jgi:hypothetical protein
MPQINGARGRCAQLAIDSFYRLVLPYIQKLKRPG